jgi:type II secretory pathway component PulJ
MLGMLSYVLLAAGLAVVLAMFVAIRRRYERMHVHLTRESRLSLPHGAVLPAALALFVAVSAVGGLAFVIVSALR